MKILIYDGLFHIISGAVKYILPIVEFLSKNNQITLIGDKYFSLDFFRKYYGIDLNNVECKYLNFKSNNIKVLSNWQHIFRCKEISNLSSQYDIFINNHLDNQWQIEPLSKYSIGMVYFPLNPYHSWQREESFKSIKNFFRKILLPSLEKYNFINKYQKIITVSNFAKKWIERYWKIKEVPVVYPWIDVKSDDDFLKENIILTVSRFRTDDSKKVREMVESFKQIVNMGIKDWSLHLVVGTGLSSEKDDWQYVKELEQLVDNLPAFFHNNLKIDELNKLYRKSKISWHLMGLGIDEEENPEKLEPFGMVTVEAMNNYCVPVVVNAGGQKEIVENGHSGFLINSCNELIEKTTFLINNTNIWKDFSHRAHKRSLFFSKEKFISQFSCQIKDFLID